MVTKVVLTQMSMVMEQATIVEWLKNEGDTVEKGEPIVEILTEKESVELEATASGVLRKILAEIGMELPVNSVIALIGEPDEPLPDIEPLIPVPISEEGAVKTEPSATEVATPTASTTIPQTPPPAEVIEGTRTRIKASPRAKRFAKERGVDLQYVTGTGPGGRIVERDVETFLKMMVSEGPQIKEERKFFGLQKQTAKKVTESYQTIPQLTHVTQVDMTNLVNYRNKLVEDRGMKISYTAFLVKAVATALEKHYLLNASLLDDTIKIYDDINLGVAIATPDGLLVPVIHKTNTKSLESIAASIKDLVTRAKQKKLRTNDFMNRTFTVSNLGMYGIDFFTSIINPPEAAILGVGRITEKPVVFNGGIHIRSMMYLNLTYDHRIIDGAPAAEFLQTLSNYLENPDQMNW